MLKKLRDRKPDNVIRAAIMIVNRTVWWQRPTRGPRSPMLVAVIHDLQELADEHHVPDLEFVLNDGEYEWDKPSYDANYFVGSPGSYILKSGKLEKVR